MLDVPIFILILFGAVVVYAVVAFYFATSKSIGILGILILYILFQSLLSLFDFYKVESAIPPRLTLLIGPGFLLAGYLCLSSKGKLFLDGLDMKFLTLLHVVRLPVEIVLYYVFAAGFIPELMTFEGNNFDILSGISAVIIFYFVFVTKKAGHRLLLIWNVIGLILLINVVSIAILTAKTPFQQLSFDQPNIGITYFPLVLLPAVVVPLVLIAHISAIRQLFFNSLEN
ncbi:hypothetical protein [Dyadobacter psychrophilus]|uniref:Uncharacterized protein n=1 Tax=Dyadobacter psychrophilus TaxID=651661 RepID=A0A1T5FSR6_9BACT|nr:hypothetical protein [Dyadobacter psychrophilus]SKB99215.1 hypothetical protein SAMN05660293_03379 [Dyadobacter psychrophilus]